MLRRLLDKFNLCLVEGWRSAWRWYSMWAHLIGTTIGGLFVLMPSMPAEVQALIPIEYRAIAVAVWLILGGVLRIVKQGPKAEPPSGFPPP